MKNALRVIAIVVVAALLFGIGYSMGSSKGISINVQYSNSGSASNGGAASVNTDTAPTTAPQTTAPQTTAPQTTAPADDKADAPADDKTDAPAEEETDAPADSSSSSVPSSTAEIVKAYNDAINNTKAYTGKVTGHKIGKMKINLDDCSVSFATSSINSILQGLISDSDRTWTFENGVGTATDDGSEKQLNNLIPPGGRNAALTEAGVASATATDNGDGTYTMKITLVAEKSTYDGTNTVNPVHNESVVDPLNLATLDISPASITAADMNYPNTSMEATVNSDGLITKLIVILPMQGSGTGKLGASLEAVISGEGNDTYEFTY